MFTKSRESLWWLFLRHTDGLSNGELLSLVKIKGKMGFLPE